MALLKEIDTPFGVKASYWKIGQVNEVFMEGQVGYDIIVFPYATKEARDNGAQPFSSPAQLRLTDDMEGYKADMTRDDVYTWLKTLPAFEGAQDA